MKTLIVIGGGAAGFFGAITAAQKYPHCKVILLEKSRQVLSKVKISGGGRCNVTHACFDPALLVKNYPRGHLELRGPFSRFQPRDIISWFEKRGVILKKEEDGRMFPITDSSETIIECLLEEVKRAGVELLIEHAIVDIQAVNQRFFIKIQNGKEILGDKILVATGSNPKMYSLLEKLGHTTVPLVPSLFTFNIPDSPFLDLSGVSLEDVTVKIPQFKLEQRGAILFTHWGLSGPSILKLSAWGARELHASEYRAEIIIDWLPEISNFDTEKLLLESKNKKGAKCVSNDSLFNLPKQLWKKMVSLAGISEEKRWSALTRKEIQVLILHLHATRLNIQGKTTYKMEFVTCGGIPLKEVNFKTMESKSCPGLFFAGEVLDIDGITGGFNFQNAWTTSWIAGNSLFD